VIAVGAVAAGALVELQPMPAAPPQAEAAPEQQRAAESA
jgi:hypothetical protein